MEKQDKKGWLDNFLAKMMSRKLTVFLISTGAFFGGQLSNEHWVYISLAYIGSQAAADIVATVKGVK